MTNTRGRTNDKKCLEDLPPTGTSVADGILEDHVGRGRVEGVWVGVTPMGQRVDKHLDLTNELFNGSVINRYSQRQILNP